MIHLFELINGLTQFDELTADKVTQFVGSALFENDVTHIHDTSTLNRYKTLINLVMQITGLKIDSKIDNRFFQRGRTLSNPYYTATEENIKDEFDKGYESVNDKLQNLVSAKVIEEAKSGHKEQAEELFSRCSKLSLLLIKVEDVEKAVKEKDWEFAKWLIEKVGVISVNLVKVKTILYRLAFNGQVELFTLLRQKTSNINLDSNVLHCAIVAASSTAETMTAEIMQRRAGGLAIAKILLEGDRLKPEQSFNLATLGTDFTGNVMVTEIRPTLHIALAADLKLLSMLVNSMDSFGTQNAQGQTALYEAIVTGHQEAVAVLLPKKDVTQTLKDKNGIAALSLIIYKLDQENYFNIAKMLVQRGINLSDLSLEQLAVLMEKLLEKEDQATLEAVLAKTGSNPQKDGKPLLEVLVLRDSQALIGYLIDQENIEINREIIPGKSVYDLAIELNRETIVGLLKEKGAKTKEERETIRKRIAEEEQARQIPAFSDSASAPPPANDSVPSKANVAAAEPENDKHVKKTTNDFTNDSVDEIKLDQNNWQVIHGRLQVLLHKHKQLLQQRIAALEPNKNKSGEIDKNTKFEIKSLKVRLAAIHKLKMALNNLPEEIKENQQMTDDLKKLVVTVVNRTMSIADKNREIDSFESKYRPSFGHKIAALIFALVGVAVGAALGFAAGMLLGGGIGPQAVATGLYGLAHGSYTGWAIGTAATMGVLGLTGGVSAGLGYYSFFGKSPLQTTMRSARTVLMSDNVAGQPVPPAVK